MDEALAEVVIDVSGRAYLIFTGTFAQQRVGSFETILLQEFLSGLASRRRMAATASSR